MRTCFVTASVHFELSNQDYILRISCSKINGISTNFKSANLESSNVKISFNSPAAQFDLHR
jgi:hypothetical protein